MEKEDNTLELFLKEHSCVQLFASLLIKHGCTSLITHGNLLHTLLYLCKSVYDRVDRKELYNRFFEKKYGIHPLLTPRCRCANWVNPCLTKKHFASYTILKETGNPDGKCEMVVSRDAFREIRKVVYKKGKRVGLQIHTGQFDLPHRVFSYHENGMKKQELRRNFQSDNYHYKAEYNEYGQKLRIYSTRASDHTFFLHSERIYANNTTPPTLMYIDRYDGDGITFKRYSTSSL